MSDAAIDRRVKLLRDVMIENAALFSDDEMDAILDIANGGEAQKWEQPSLFDADTVPGPVPGTREEAKPGIVTRIGMGMAPGGYTPHMHLDLFADMNRTDTLRESMKNHPANGARITLHEVNEDIKIHEPSFHEQHEDKWNTRCETCFDRAVKMEQEGTLPAHVLYPDRENCERCTIDNVLGQPASKTEPDHDPDDPLCRNWDGEFSRKRISPMCPLCNPNGERLDKREQNFLTILGKIINNPR